MNATISKAFFLACLLAFTVSGESGKVNSGNRRSIIADAAAHAFSTPAHHQPISAPAIDGPATDESRSVASHQADTVRTSGRSTNGTGRISATAAPTSRRGDVFTAGWHPRSNSKVIPGSGPVDRHYVRPDRDKFHTVSAAAGEDIPLALLAGMVDDNPWKDVLAASEGNPFSRAIQDMIEGSGEETGATEAGDDAGKPGTGDQEHAQDHSDEGTPQGDDGSTTDNGYNGGGDSGNSNLDGNYPKMVMLSGWGNGISTDYVYQYDSDIYSTADGTMSQLAVKWIPGHSPLDQFYFCDDFDADGRADVLQTLRLKGICQLLLNTGFSWAGLRPFYLPYQPTCLTRMICMDPTQPQLVVYSAQARSVDVLEDLGDGRFESMLDFPMPTAYDGLAASDINNDGYDDYIFLAVTENRANYLINVDGQSLRPLITAPYFPSPRNYRFTANPGSQLNMRLMLLNYRRQCLLYWVDIYGRGIPVLGVTRLDPGTCILVGDINDDGIPDVGFGHILR